MEKVRFSGEVSYAIKLRELVKGFVLYFVMLPLISVAMIIIGIIDVKTGGNMYASLFWGAVIFTVLFVPPLAYIFYKQFKVLNKPVTVDILIQDGKIVNGNSSVEIKKYAKLVNYGDYYVLKGANLPQIIFEKCLLKEGTTQDFEQIIKSVLERE